MADFDAVIVGAGAGGGVIARELCAAGWRVALIEKGRNPWPNLGADTLRGSLLGNDEVRRRRFYAFHDPLIEPRTFRASSDATATRAEFQGLGVGVGGGTVQYDGDSPRVQRADLALLSTYGPVAGADVVDWPLTYEKLEPAYDAVEALIGVQGLANADPFAESRNPYPMPPGYPSRAGLVLSAGAEALGLHPHPMPMAINSMGYGGRPACANCGFCNAGCPINAKGSTAVTVVRDALQTGNLTLLSECCVTEVLVTESGEAATGVRYVDPAGDQQTLTATHVVLAANAIETPRLLLASTSHAHPNGLGNASALVGRHLMFHMVFSAVGVFDAEIRSYRGRVVTHALADWTVPDGTSDWVRGGYVELGGSIHPVEEGIAYPWQLHRTYMLDGKWRRRIASVTMIGEDVPVATNRVELDPDLHDVYGRPVARVTYGRHTHDQAVIDRYMPRLRDVAEAAGAVEVMEMDFLAYDGVPNTRHLHGTTRMGTDPATSVCDAYGRLHTVANVWIADGGLFPTSTSFNPTLTQQALAWRTARHMLEAQR